MANAWHQTQEVTRRGRAAAGARARSAHAIAAERAGSSTVSCSLAEDATHPGAARATTPDDVDESLLKPMRLQDVNPETRIGAGNMRRVLA